MPAMGSTLGEVARRVGGEVIGDSDIWLADVTHDSRSAGPEVLFVAVRGEEHDGHAYVEAAVASGSPAVAVEHPMAIDAGQLIVDDTRAVMSVMAAEVHSDPSHRVAVIGVTGTNGKTTVTHYIESLMRSAGRVAGLIGTVETRVGSTVIPSERTTPEATDFQRLLATMRDLGAELIAAEISSHALDMNRVASTRFAVAAFTNLSQDHLDFHGTMESYRSAKERLFRDFDIGTSVINVDDPVGADIAGWVRGPKILVGRRAEVRAGEIHSSFDGTSFQLVTPLGNALVSSSLVGAFNVENALVAVGCCLALGSSLDEIILGLSELRVVPGRFELIGEREGVRVVVDYAHTPDGIHEAISVARALSDGRVIAVVGAGGDRDREKRPLMGRAASEADVAIITSDNPRTEDPDRILNDVAAGATTGKAVLEVDRRRAIAKAIDSAERGDVVLILGKGHETGQEIDGRLFPFDDRDVARELLGISPSSPESGPDSGSMSL